MKRFQECNRVVKLWRYRHYVYNPFKFIGILVLKTLDPNKKENLGNKMIWKVLIGDAQCSMNWTYTSEEVREFINKKKDDRKRKMGDS